MDTGKYFLETTVTTYYGIVSKDRTEYRLSKWLCRDVTYISKSMYHNYLPLESDTSRSQLIFVGPCVQWNGHGFGIQVIGIKVYPEGGIINLIIDTKGNDYNGQDYQ